MEYIKNTGLPDNIAQRAYQDGYYVEAIQVLHGFLENQARSLLMLVGCVHFTSEQKDVWDSTDTISLNVVLKILYILNQINKDEYEQFKKLNNLRNKIVHQIYKEPYDKEFLGVPKNEYDQVFQGTLNEIYFFTRKCEEIIE